MSKPLLKQAIQQELSLIHQHLKLYVADREAERLHQIRVSVKKIRAYIYLTEITFHVKYTEDHLKKLFKTAGQLRELQIAVVLVEAIRERPLNFINRLKKETQQNEERFAGQCKTFRKELKKNERSFIFPTRLAPKEELIRFFKQEWKTCQKLLLKHDRMALHEYRRKLKYMMYAFNILPKKLRNQISIDKKSIDKMQEKIGDWHNLHSLIEFLQQQSKDTEVQDILRNLKYEETKKFKEIQEYIQNHRSIF